MDNKMQTMAREFFNEHGMSEDISSRLLDLVSEVGELCDEHVEITERNTKDFSPTTEWHLEMGDIMFVLATLANRTGVDLEVVLEASLNKMRERFKDTGQIGSG
jgi:NTP pyrophosphatase (non-canonical NTP hydrolase)